MRELGLFGLSIPPEYGGLGFSVVQKALVHEMMGRGPWGLATFLSQRSVRCAHADNEDRSFPCAKRTLLISTRSS